MNMDSILKQMNMSNVSDDDKKQAEQIWKMLDTMQNDSPEKFVKKNIEQGMTQMKDKQEKEQEHNKVIVNKSLLYKFQANLKKVEKKDEDQKIKQMLQEGQQNPKFDKEAKFYLNICTSDKMCYPLDKNGILVKQCTTIGQLNVIPFSISDFQTKKSALNLNIYFYDLTVNEDFFSQINKFKASIVDYLIQNFQARLKTDKNPLLKDLKSDIFYYELEKNDKPHKKKNYKNLISSPQPQLLDEGTLQSKYDNRIKENKKQEILIKEKETVADIEIKMPSQIQEKPKKNLIQEIEPTSEKEQDDRQPPHQIQYQDGKINIEILLPKVNKFSEIDLQINEQELKLNHSEYDLNLDFKQRCNSDSVQAKWDRKQKKLKIDLTIQ